jgi:hypothetical protein
MSWGSRLFNAVMVAAVMALPLKVASCGRTVCITVTAAQLAKNGGACPSPEDAMNRFSSSDCSPSNVTLLQGNGELDGMLCCYPAELSDNGAEGDCEETTGGCAGDCGEGGDFGTSAFATGSSGFSATVGEGGSSGFGGSEGFGGNGGSGFGGFGGSGFGGGTSSTGGAGGAGGAGSDAGP